MFPAETSDRGRPSLLPCDGDADELAFLGFAGDGGVGSGGDFFVVGGDSGLVGVDGNGYVGLGPGTAFEVSGEFYGVGEAWVDGGFDAQEGDLEGTRGGLGFGEGVFAVGLGGITADGVFEQVVDPVMVGVGFGVLEGWGEGTEFFSGPGFEGISGGVGVDDGDGTGNGSGLVEGEVGEGVG